MTKVDAIEKVMEQNGGAASLSVIYDNIERYYPAAKASEHWTEGVRGVLYRELRKDNSRFRKIGSSIYALRQYKEERVPEKDKIRMHSFMEGLCIELGNEQKFKTYSADPSAKYRDNAFIKDVVTMQVLPQFTYEGILHEAKLIDVLWFDNSQYPYPQYAFEIVDSIGTLNGAFNRCMQLINFRTKFYIVAPEKHREKFEQTLNMNVYRAYKEYFEFKDYETMLNAYKIFVSGASAIDWLR